MRSDIKCRCKSQKSALIYLKNSGLSYRSIPEESEYSLSGCELTNKKPISGSGIPEPLMGFYLFKFYRDTATFPRYSAGISDSSRQMLMMNLIPNFSPMASSC